MADVLRLTPDFPSELDSPIVRQRKTSADLDVPVESVGQDLCKVRQQRGKTLMDVWRDLKIPPHHLIAIEKGCFEALPGRPYAVGFVRSYAAYLGLDAETFVARLKAEMAGPHIKRPVAAPSAQLERKHQLVPALSESGNGREPETALSSPPERWAPQWVTAGLMSAVLMYSGYYAITSALRAAPPPVIPVPARLAAEASLIPKKVGPPALAPIEQPAPVAHELPLTPSTEVAPAQPVAADAKPAPTFHAPLPLGEHYGEHNRNSHVTLRVHRPTRVAVLGTRNHSFIDRVLGAGDTYRVPNIKGLKLSVRDAGAVEVILDDNTVGFAGQDGVAARGLSLDPQSIIKRYHWLQR